MKVKAALVAISIFIVISGCNTNQKTKNAARQVSNNSDGKTYSSTLAKVKKSGVLRAGIRYDFPPVSYIDNDGQWKGFDIDLADELAKRLGTKLEKIKVDETTRISFLQDGRIDIAVASMNHTREREEAVDFSQTYFWGSQTFLVKKDKYSNLKQLFGKTVAMNKGSSAIDGWKKWTKENGGEPGRIVEFANKQEALQALSNGAVEGYGEDNIPLATLASNNKDLKLLDEGFNPVQYGIGLRENDSDWRDAINFAMEDMEKDGTFNKIYNKYFGSKSTIPLKMSGKIEQWP